MSTFSHFAVLQCQPDQCDDAFGAVCCRNKWKLLGLVVVLAAAAAVAVQSGLVAAAIAQAQAAAQVSIASERRSPTRNCVCLVLRCAPGICHTLLSIVHADAAGADPVVARSTAVGCGARLLL